MAGNVNPYGPSVPQQQEPGAPAFYNPANPPPTQQQIVIVPYDPYFLSETERKRISCITAAQIIKVFSLGLVFIFAVLGSLVVSRWGWWFFYFWFIFLVACFDTLCCCECWGGSSRQSSILDGFCQVFLSVMTLVAGVFLFVSSTTVFSIPFASAACALIDTLLHLILLLIICLRPCQVDPTQGGQPPQLIISQGPYYSPPEGAPPTIQMGPPTAAPAT